MPHVPEKPPGIPAERRPEGWPERWHLFGEVTSTNDTVLAAAEEGEPEGTVHIATSQTRGRGRHGRSWWSPSGAGLWMSVLLRPRVEAAMAPAIALLAGKAAKDAIEPLVKRPIEIHWPNDLVVDGRKLGGILCELRSAGGRYWVALGIGINLDFRSHRAPDKLRLPLTDFREAGGTAIEPVELARRLTLAFWPLYNRYREGASLASLLGQGAIQVGRRVSIADTGGEPFEGRIAGLESAGQLLVDDGRTLRTITAGDVTYL
jgi:BirA family biotin operon repressor/biotin-[acetyl-CoA-carboxylase] ligase